MKQSEAEVSQSIRLIAPKHSMRLWRNNNGAVYDTTGRLIRYGLCNESKQQSKQFKSSDLIGLTQYTIKSEDVGKTFAIFTSIEVKRSKWKFTGIAREIAQLNWINLINSFGGFAFFATKPEDLER